MNGGSSLVLVNGSSLNRALMAIVPQLGKPIFEERRGRPANRTRDLGPAQNSLSLSTETVPKGVLLQFGQAFLARRGCCKTLSLSLKSLSCTIRWPDWGSKRRQTSESPACQFPLSHSDDNYSY
jgi:hypothetical protein